MLLRKKLILSIVSLTVISNITVTTEAAQETTGVKVSGGEDHSLVLTENKAVWGCGDNGFYQLGIGDDTAYKCTLIRVHDGDMNTPSDYLEDINDIDAGWMHSLALDVNGFVWAWGNDSWGQLGNGPAGSSSTPVQVLSGEQDPGDANSFLQYIECISAGRSGVHSLAADSNGYAWAWGSNEYGQLGDDNYPTDQCTPVEVHGGEMGTEFLEDIIAVSAGEEQSMALDANSFVWTWGDNAYGKLGNGSTVDSPTPVKVKSGKQDPNNPNSYLKNIVAISAGWDHCMALEKLDPNDPNCNGRVYTWGNNGQGVDSQDGRLGDGTLKNSSTPVIVLSGWQDPNDPNSSLKNIIAISAGEGPILQH